MLRLNCLQDAHPPCASMVCPYGLWEIAAQVVEKPSYKISEELPLQFFSLM